MQSANTSEGGPYLSRLRLNPASRAVMRCLNNSQSMHSLLLHAFPHGDRSQHTMLYRIDPVAGRRDGAVDVLVQSSAQPSWEFLVREGIVREIPDPFDDSVVKDLRGVFAQVAEGDIYRFRLRANPTKRVPWNVWALQHPTKALEYQNSSRRYTSPRVPVTVLTGQDLEKPIDQRPSAEDKLREWLIRKGHLNGFVVARVEIGPDPVTGDMQLGRKMDDAKNPLPLAHKAIVYQGLLKVTDREQFVHALTNGIGSGKAYGFGLVSLARAGEG